MSTRPSLELMLVATIGFLDRRSPDASHPHRPRGNERYVRRKKGKFTKSQDDMGRSLAADRRRKAKRVAKRGEGDRGDQKRRKVSS